MNTTNWIKCASVTAGGKPHFWKHRTRPLWVVWDRIDRKWIVENGYKTLSRHDTEPAAIDTANSIP